MKAPVGLEDVQDLHGKATTITVRESFELGVFDLSLAGARQATVLLEHRCDRRLHCVVLRLGNAHGRVSEVAPLFKLEEAAERFVDEHKVRRADVRRPVMPPWAGQQRHRSRHHVLD